MADKYVQIGWVGLAYIDGKWVPTPPDDGDKRAIVWPRKSDATQDNREFRDFYEDDERPRTRVVPVYVKEQSDE